jgi:hypothetical protein
MTAYKVIDNHKDLDGIGSFTPDQIESQINTTPFVLVSGSGTPPSPSGRILVAGPGVQIVDSGPGGFITVSAVSTPQPNAIPMMAWMEIPVGDTDGSNTVFNLQNPPFPTNSLQLYENGVLQQGGGNDYLLSDSTFIMNIPPESGSFLVATYVYRFLVPYGESVSWMEVPSGDIDDSNVEFTLQYTPDPRNSLMLYINGILQSLDDDYTLVGNKITVVYPPQSGSKLIATYAYSVILPTIGTNTSWLEVPGGDADGINTVFSSSSPPLPESAMMLFINGVLQRQDASSDYILSGSTIALSVPPPSGSNIVVNYPY